MSLSDETQKKLRALQSAAQEFFQFVNVIDGNYDNKESEIKVLAMKIEGMKEELLAVQNKANAILQEAHEQTSSIRKEAARLLEEAKIQKAQAETILVENQKKIQEASVLHETALQRQKEADTQYKIYVDRKKQLEEAVNQR